jgi:hypothetical protein
MLKRSRLNRFFVFKLWHQFRVQTPPGVDFMKQFRPQFTDKTFQGLFKVCNGLFAIKNTLKSKTFSIMQT